jgi:two-component SAPR family response regulator
LGSTASQDFLHSDEITISFEAEAEYWLDAAEILRRKEPVTWTTQELVEAAGLYKGELLPGFYDEWIVVERERIQAVFEHKMHCC